MCFTGKLVGCVMFLFWVGESDLVMCMYGENSVLVVLGGGSPPLPPQMLSYACQAWFEYYSLDFARNVLAVASTLSICRLGSFARYVSPMQ